MSSEPCNLPKPLFLGIKSTITKFLTEVPNMETSFNFKFVYMVINSGSDQNKYYSMSSAVEYIL